jgi:CRP-like cAMP-binding protein
MTAPTLEERIDAWAHGSAQLLARLGPMLPVAEEASALEPEIARARQEGREETRAHIRRFWASAAGDGLLPDGTDVRWLTDTTVLLISADAFLQAMRLSWSPRGYERWMRRTIARLVAAAR